MGRKAQAQSCHVLRLPGSESLKQDGTQVAVPHRRLASASTPGTRTSPQPKPAVPAHGSPGLGCRAPHERLQGIPTACSNASRGLDPPSMLFWDLVRKGTIRTYPAPRASAARQHFSCPNSLRQKKGRLASVNVEQAGECLRTATSAARWLCPERELSSERNVSVEGPSHAF